MNYLIKYFIFIFLIIFSSAFNCNFSSPKTEPQVPVKEKEPIEEVKIIPEKKEPPKEIIYEWMNPEGESFDFTRLKEFPQDPQRKVQQIFITNNEKYVIIVTAFKLIKVSLETLQEVGILDHRRIVDGGFTGIGISEDGEWIVAGSSWQTKASLYDWSGKPLANFPCGAKGSYVEDAHVSMENQKVLLSCLRFGSGKKEIISFDTKGNLEWKKQETQIYMESIPEINRIISYEGKEVTILSESGEKEKQFQVGLDIVTMSFAPKEKILLLGNSKEWNVLKLGETENETVLKVNAESDLFIGENYNLTGEYKSFYKMTSSGKYLFTGGRGGAYLWTTKGKLVKKFTGHQRNVSAVNLSNSEKFLITASPDRYIIWQRTHFNLN